MEIKTLTGISTKEILSVFNASFSDYFIPFHLSEEQLTAKLLADKVSLDLSVGVFEDGKPIAFILHGFDIINGEKIIYNGGTGVVPEKRGLGLTRKMYDFILPILKQKDINTLHLEVITENIQAIKSYENSGYKIERALSCYKGDITISTTNNEVVIKKLQEYNWSVMGTFWDIAPTWQNSINVVNELSATNISLGAYNNDQLVGYIILSPQNKRIQQIAIDKNFRQRKIASTLLQELIAEYGNAISIINVDKSATHIDAFLQSLGFEKNVEQLEMKLQLH
jgi:ribosomal protein S18 acetylase RimI-like enzyme